MAEGSGEPEGAPVGMPDSDRLGDRDFSGACAASGTDVEQAKSAPDSTTAEPRRVSEWVMTRPLCLAAATPAQDSSTDSAPR